MEKRALKLQIAKGPRQGDELEFKPGSRIRIGRVVRGNNVAIKDAGISTNHLSIEFDPRSGAWILQDLGSSNGTLINGSSNLLSPNTPYTINDGDIIKIGESTSILVRLDDSCCVVDELPPPNPRRRGRHAAGKRNLKEEDATGVFKEAEKSVKAAGAFKETLGLKEAEESVKAAGVLKETLGSKEADEEIVKEDRVLKEVEKINPENDRIVQAPRLSPRKTRSRMKKVVDEKIGENNCEEKKSNLGKRTRASSRRKQNDVEKLNPVVIAAANVNAKVSNLEEEEETGQPDQMCNEKDENSGGREKGNDSAANGRTLDLTKLTVRELFDYLEENIPKQIIAETDKSLAAMREKVERIKDYVREQRKKN